MKLPTSNNNPTKLLITYSVRYKTKKYYEKIEYLKDLLGFDLDFINFNDNEGIDPKLSYQFITNKTSCPGRVQSNHHEYQIDATHPNVEPP